MNEKIKREKENVIVNLTKNEFVFITYLLEKSLQYNKSTEKNDDKINTILYQKFREFLTIEF